MTETMPRITAVETRLPATVIVDVDNGERYMVDLTGWIATGGEIFARLQSSDIFELAFVSDHGAAIAWDDGDLAIYARHLQLLAREQQEFDRNAIVAWQTVMELSNHEAA